MSTAKIEIGSPRVLTSGGVLVLSAYGLLLMIPVLLSFLVVSLHPFGLRTFLTPLIVFGAVTFFLPLGFGNPRVTKLVRAMTPAAGKGQDGFVVQLTCSPRIRSGFSAVLEDADDIGWLTLTPSELRFHGDSVQLSLPYEEIERLEARSIGWRGLFLYGQRVTLEIAHGARPTKFEFTERSSWVLPASRRTARELYRRLASKLPVQKAGGARNA